MAIVLHGIPIIYTPQISNRTVGLMFKNFITGFFVGLANIVPGVSGGTFLLIFGIYDRTIGAINNMLPVLKTMMVTLPRLLKQESRADAGKELMTALAKSNLVFLLTIMIGSGTAIIVLSQLIKYLLEHHLSPTYGLFFGFILISIAIPFKMIRKRTPLLLFSFLLGAGATIAITAAVNPYDKVIGKSAIYAKKFIMHAEPEATADNIVAPPGKLHLQGKYSTREYVYAFFCGAIGVSAMVLPGISGSLVLILMGEYFEVVSAIANLRTLQLDYPLFLALFALGMVVGIVVFARLVNYIFSRFHDHTMSLLTGLVAGSLYALWPFKQFATADIYTKVNGTITLVKDMVIQTNRNTLPSLNETAVSTFVAMVAGAVIMVVLFRFESKKE